MSQSVQSFGGALNCNPHVHALLPDGVFVEGDAVLTFAELSPPTQQDVEGLAERIARRLGAIARRRIGDERLVDEDEALLHAASAEALRLPGIAGHAEIDPRHLCARVNGFTLHAGRSVEAHDRDALERLLRYILRAPFSAERFSLDDKGLVHYRLRKPWPGPGGTTDLVLEPLSLMRRLAALVPRPYTNLFRYFGVFSNRSKHRPLLPSPAAPGTPSPDAASVAPSTESTDPSSPASTSDRPRRLPWSQLIRRVLDIDVLTCPQCSVPMLVIAFITDAPVVRKILDHLGLPSSPPQILPARRSWEDAPPDEPGWFAEEYREPPAGARSSRDPPSRT